MTPKQFVEQFWAVMGANDFLAASLLLHEQFCLEWPQSGVRTIGAPCEGFDDVMRISR